MKASVVSLMAFLSLAGCGTAPSWPSPPGVSTEGPITVQAPDWHVGSEWLYSDGYGLRVSRVDGPVTTFQRIDDPRQWVVRRGFLREDAQSATTLRKLLFEDLPAGAGLILSSRAPLTYRRDYTANGAERTHVTSWTIEGRQTVKVPAGEFDCDVLVMRTRNQVDGWSGFERWWFSSKAQNFVRMEYRYGQGTAGSRVLTQLRLSDDARIAPAPAPARPGSTR